MASCMWSSLTAAYHAFEDSLLNPFQIVGMRRPNPSIAANEFVPESLSVIVTDFTFTLTQASDFVPSFLVDDPLDFGIWLFRTAYALKAFLPPGMGQMQFVVE